MRLTILGPCGRAQTRGQRESVPCDVHVQRRRVSASRKVQLESGIAMYLLHPLDASHPGESRPRDSLGERRRQFHTILVFEVCLKAFTYKLRFASPQNTPPSDCRSKKNSFPNMAFIVQ